MVILKYYLFKKEIRFTFYNMISMYFSNGVSFLPKTILKSCKVEKLPPGAKSRSFPITGDKIMMAATYFIADEECNPKTLLSRLTKHKL